MFALLLAIIYLAFISLGLPDSLLGSAWPVMHEYMNVNLSNMGIITMLISGGTIISSLFSAKLTKKFGPGLVTCLSVLLTALGMLGFSFSTEFWHLCVLALPYGLGAGTIDAALNNYVALHYSSKHMSWLHSFWGVGTIISPYIMSYALNSSAGWWGGYRIVAIIQLSLFVFLLLSLGLWNNTKTNEAQKEMKSLSFIEILKTRGVVFVLITFFSYCALELTAMSWSSTYFVNHHNLDPVLASSLAALFCFGITGGRFITGIVTNKFGDRKMIYIGLYIILVGIILLALPVNTHILALVGFVLIGLGCAPIYPSIIHSTPSNFGKDKSQSIIGVEMASAYVGSTFMPPLFGLIAQYLSIKLLPVFLLIFALLMFTMMGLLKKILRKENLNG